MFFCIRFYNYIALCVIRIYVSQGKSIYLIWFRCSFIWRHMLHRAIYFQMSGANPFFGSAEINQCSVENKKGAREQWLFNSTKFCESIWFDLLSVCLNSRFPLTFSPSPCFVVVLVLAIEYNRKKINRIETYAVPNYDLSPLNKISFTFAYIHCEMCLLVCHPWLAYYCSFPFQ